ncbi:MAG: hypothetical protein PHW79_00165 [Candidatus Marinimicrobia bacterium]|nr:hypothetical protein [Candidatus Neomarinimicrobiota bacterium]
MEPLYRIFNQCQIRIVLSDNYLLELFEPDKKEYAEQLSGYINLLYEIRADIAHFREHEKYFSSIREIEQYKNLKVIFELKLRSQIFREWIFMILDNMAGLFEKSDIPGFINSQTNQDYFNDIRADISIIESKTINAIEKAEKERGRILETLEITNRIKALTSDTPILIPEIEIKPEQAESDRDNANNSETIGKPKKRGRTKGTKDKSIISRNYWIRKREIELQKNSLARNAIYSQIQTEVKQRFHKELSIRTIKNIIYK